jgi:hypothetical protein
MLGAGRWQVNVMGSASGFAVLNANLMNHGGHRGHGEPPRTKLLCVLCSLSVKPYFIPGMGMSELKMSHWVFQAPPDFFLTSIHLPWSKCDPSAPVISYVPVP